MGRAGRRFVWGAAFALASVATRAEAVLPRAGVSSGGLEAPAGAPPLRTDVRVAYAAVPASRRGSWQTFVADAGGSWNALWDRDTDAPLRIFGSGIVAPGSVASPASAEATARMLLQRHLALLAPRARPSDFVLVANVLERGMRTVAFEQHVELAPGIDARVVGGRLSFRFKNDRMIVAASEAVATDRGAPLVPAGDAQAAALGWIAGSHASVALEEPAELVALPLVFARASSVAPARPAWRVRVTASDPPGRYDVYLDARTGAPIARDALLRFAQATARFDAPVRAPQAERQAYPATLLDVVVNGTSAVTDESGIFAWPDAGDATVDLGVEGKRVHVDNVAGVEATATFDAPDAHDVVWSLATDEIGDAQLSSFIHTGIAKARARLIVPSLSFVDGALVVHDNRPDDQGCNAYWDGYSLNFLRENEQCNNSARVADVVYHEFGHAFHQHVMIPGVADYEPALTEGAGDYFAVTITGDPILGPGFFLGGGYLRELDTDRRWPDDIDSDPHMTGLIFAGTMWDLRTALAGELGERMGVRVADELYYGILQHASSIPTTYVDALAADDDDGDLSNGTPHVCALNVAFAHHGLAPVLNAAGVTLEHDPLTLVQPGQPSFVRATAHVLYPQCIGAEPLGEVRIEYHGEGGVAQIVELSAEGDDWVGELPSQPAGTALRYRLVAQAGDVTIGWPDNPADGSYSVFVGDEHNLYCTDFEHDADGWVAGDDQGKALDFEWGTPSGKAGDPDHAFSGKKIFGNDLGATDGAYRPRRTSWLDAPRVDVGGERHVRLQFRRWLTVQDGYYDHATVYANGSWIWQNGGTDENGFLNHVDKEWRFVDLDLASPAATGSIQLRFELAADNDIELGGWNIDDVCVVAWTPPEDTSAPSPPDDTLRNGDSAGLDASGGCALRAPDAAPRWSAWALACLVALLASNRRLNRETGRRGGKREIL